MPEVACVHCGEDEVVTFESGAECLACGRLQGEGEGDDLCGHEDSPVPCDCKQPVEYRGDDRVRGL